MTIDDIRYKIYNTILIEKQPALSSNKIGKEEYLTGEKKLLSNQKEII